MGWLTQERITWMLGIVLAAGIGYGAGEASHNQEFVDAQIAPVVEQDKADRQKLDCQKKRADVATLAATKDDVDPSVIPSCPK